MKSYTLFKIGMFFFYFALVHNAYASQCTPEQVQKMITAGFSKDEIMNICTPPSETTIPGQTNLPKINWILAEEYFHISNPKVGKYRFRNILGQIFMLDAIEFNITAKSGIPLTLMLKAVFYDSDGIKMSESIIAFEKKYNTGFWEIGDPGKGYITMDLKTLSDTRLIEITNF